MVSATVRFTVESWWEANLVILGKELVSSLGYIIVRLCTKRRQERMRAVRET